MKWDFLQDSARIAAPLLLGATIVTTIDGVSTSGRIVEVEAYTETDPASHSYGGLTKRNAAMFAEPGTLYTYISYGMHVCMNVVTGPSGVGQGILIRAVEPLDGIGVMWERRYAEILPSVPSPRRLHDISNGPGKLTQALGVSVDDGNTNLLSPLSTVKIELPSKVEQYEIFNSRRIGISKGVETPWRWYLQSRWVSKVPKSILDSATFVTEKQ